MVKDPQHTNMLYTMFLRLHHLVLLLFLRQQPRQQHYLRAPIYHDCLWHANLPCVRACACASAQPRMAPSLVPTTIVPALSV